MTDILLLLLMAGLAAGLVVPRLLGKRKPKTSAASGPGKPNPGGVTSRGSRMPITSGGDSYLNHLGLGGNPAPWRGSAAPTPFGGEIPRQNNPLAIPTEASPTVYLATPSTYLLEVTAGPDGGQKYGLMSGVNHIGRAPGTHVQLTDPTVSGQHAIIELGAEGATLYDDSSTNGTFLNGHQVLEPRALKVGDQVTIGRTTVVLRT